MGPIWARLRSELRARWRAWAVLAVLIGLFGGVVLGVATGARRTATAFPRLVEASNTGQALVSVFGTGLTGYYDELARDESVVESGVVAGMPVVPLTPAGEPDESAGNIVAPVDGKVAYSLDRVRVLKGRLPNVDHPREILVDELAAAEHNLRVGSRLSLVAIESDPADFEGEPLSVTPFTATVVGVGRFVEEVVPTAKFDISERMLMSPAAYREYAEGRPLFFDGAIFRLEENASVSDFHATASRLAQEHEDTTGEIIFADNVDRDRRVDRTIRPQWAALVLFAAFAGLAGFFVLGQALARQLSDDATETPILRTLGMTRGQLVRLTLLRAALVAGVAAALAVLVAVALSPLFPIGAARRAELNDGVEVNVGLLAAGAALILLLLVARAAVPAWRLATAPAGVQGTAAALGADRPSLLASRLSAAALPPSAAAGVRMALEPGRGRTAVPVRATLMGAIVGLAAVATSVTFATNLDRVVTDPRLYGRGWDLLLDASFGGIEREKAAKVLGSSPAVTSWSGGYYGEASIAGTAVTALGVDGPVGPVIVEGRRPRSDDEAVLGSSMLGRAGRRVGDRIDVTLADATVSMKVVGRAVFPAMGRGSFPQTGLGDGVLLTSDAFPPPPDLGSEGDAFFNFYLVQLRDGASAAQLAELTRDLERLCPTDQMCLVPAEDEHWERPAEITNLDRIRWTPVVLAGLLAALAVATVGHTLVTSIRRRRRDLALLKTMGFQRGQVSAAVAWQATTFAVVSAVVGLPVGLALGRVLWRTLAEQLGIVPDVVTPALPLLLALPATLLMANLIAVVPGWLAGRVRPAVALRAE